MALPAGIVASEDATAPLFAGVDVGGTNIKIGIVDNRARRVAQASIPTEQEQGPQVAAKRTAAALADMIEQHRVDRRSIARVGLATPGPMDLEAGILLIPGNLPAWHNCPIRDLMSEACGFPVTYANDANAAAYGEYWCGAGQDARSMVLFTMGTGIGGGVIVDDYLVEGEHGCGSELGHLIIDCTDGAPINTLGIRGTLEGYCGAYAIVRRVKSAIAAGAKTSIRARVEAGEELTPKMLAEEAEAGDVLAEAIIIQTAKYMAIGAVTAIHFVDPESVVLAGAMTFGGAGHPLGERFIEKIRAECKPRLIGSIVDKVSIDFATLGGDAGFIGAAGLARREYAS